MTVSNASIKMASKSAIKNNLISSIAVTVITMTVWFICHNISAVFSLIAGNLAANIIFAVLLFLIASPLAVGLIRYFWRMIYGQKENPVWVFYYFSSRKNYLKVLHLVLALLIRTVICLLIFSIPVFVLKLITGTWLYSALNVSIPIWTANLSNLINFLQFISVTATSFYMLKFYLAPMLFVADENMDTAEAIHLSTVVCKRTLLDFVFLCFSFTGWIILSLLTLPMIFTLPYIIMSYLIHCSYAVGGFNEEIAKISHDDIPTFVAGV